MLRIVALFVFFGTSIGASDFHQKTDIIIQAVDDSFEGSRFDYVSVDFTNCSLRVEVIDENACSSGAAVKSIVRYVDLMAHEAIIPSGQTESRIFAIFKESGDWALQSKILNQRMKMLLDRASLSVGPGPKSAHAATADFLKVQPLDALRSYTLFRRCGGEEVISFERKSISFSGFSPEVIIREIESAKTTCASREEK